MEQDWAKSYPYCDGKITLLIGYKENRGNQRFSILFNSKNSALSFVKDSMDDSHDPKEIDRFLLVYCPMCGRKL